MSDKALFVIDNPENCMECELCFEIDEGIEACCMIQREENDNSSLKMIEGDYCQSKPLWCPLKPIPEKKETYTTLECHTNGSWTEGMKAGWNACIDAITGGNTDD